MTDKPQKKPMTPAEKEVMDAVRALFKDSPEVAPSQNQIAAKAEKKPSAVSRAVASLVAKGWLTKGEGHYSIQVVE